MIPFSLRIYRPQDRLSPLLVTDDPKELLEHLHSHAKSLSKRALLETMEYAVRLWDENPGKMHHIPLNRYCGLRISSNLLED